MPRVELGYQSLSTDWCSRAWVLYAIMVRHIFYSFCAPVFVLKLFRGSIWAHTAISIVCYTKEYSHKYILMWSSLFLQYKCSSLCASSLCTFSLCNFSSICSQSMYSHHKCSLQWIRAYIHSAFMYLILSTVNYVLSICALPAHVLLAYVLPLLCSILWT